MRVISFIPVRGGSKSIPLKNIRDFCGKPLVCWTAMAAAKNPEVDEVVIATDSDTIARTVMDMGVDKIKIYRRLKENADDHSTTESVILEYLEHEKHDPEDLFILIQATSPLLQTDDISRGIDRYRAGGFDSLLSCVRTKRFFWSENGEPWNYDPMNRPRRQDFQGSLMENGAFYINSVAGIMKFGNRIAGRIGIVEMPEFTFGELDEEEDWLQMERAMYTHILGKKPTQIKLILSDVDGVLTDAGMYYSEKGDEQKKFNTRDGMGFQMAREAGFKTGIITSENTKIVDDRARKLKVDFLVQGKQFGGKLKAAKSICDEMQITLDQVAYIGDDINCLELLKACGLAACPSDASTPVRSLPNIRILNQRGGYGVFREFVECILKP